MKKLLAILLALLITGLPAVLAEEETAEYRDRLYAFRYPASWSCTQANNGDVVLVSPDGNAAVLTFAIINETIILTGSAETDAPLIDSIISGYDGANLVLSGEYDPIESNGLHGFRAYGTWSTGNLDSVMIILTGNRHIVGFTLAGTAAIAMEQELLDSLELLGDEPSAGSAGFLRWDAPSFSVEYPESYRALDSGTGVGFISPDDPNVMVLVRAYDLEIEYSDALAPSLASGSLPQSTHVEPNPEMTMIGGRQAAVIRGAVAGSPMEYYMIGSGKTALGLLFMGTDSVALAEHIIQSAEIK